MFRTRVSRFVVVCTAIVGACCAVALPATGLIAGPATVITADDGTGTTPPTTTPPPVDPGGHGWIG
jgi:hypothetical protein